MSGHDHAAQLLLGRAVLWLEHFGSGADRAHADLQFKTKLFRMRPHLPQMFRLQVADKTDLRKVDYLDPAGSTIIKRLKRGPFLRPQAEKIDA